LTSYNDHRLTCFI